MKNTENDRPLEWYLSRIEYLSGFMLPERAETLRKVIEGRTRYMTICTENTFDPRNASALVRHCDAFGIQDVFTIEEHHRFKPNVHIVKGTDKWITFRRSNSTEGAVASLRQSGYRIIATTPHPCGTTPENFDISAGPFALVFGAEHDGISETVSGQADGFIHIPMAGFVDSLNVSASAAILLYILSERLRASDVKWQLADLEKATLLFDWTKSSVRHSEKILRKFEESCLQGHF